MSVYEKLAGRLRLTDLPALFVVVDIRRGELLFGMKEARTLYRRALESGRLSPEERGLLESRIAALPE